MGCSDSPIGTLRNRITIESRTRVSDEMGGGTITWTTFATVWARLRPSSARETFFSKHLEHRVTHTVTIRYLAGVTSDMRITFGSRTFQIKGIRNLEEKNRYLELSCEEGVPA